MNSWLLHDGSLVNRRVMIQVEEDGEPGSKVEMDLNDL